MSRIASISKKLESGVGFSNGWAPLTLKKPPPLVPSCLMATCDAAGPIGKVCLVTGFLSPSTVGCNKATCSYDRKFWITPCETSTTARIKDKGRRMYNVERVRSTQKLP